MQVRIQNRIAMQQRASRAASNDEDSEGTLDAEHAGGGAKREVDNSNAPAGPPPVRRKLNRALWDTMEHRFDAMQLSLWEGICKVGSGSHDVETCVAEPGQAEQRFRVQAASGCAAVKPDPDDEMVASDELAVSPD